MVFKLSLSVQPLLWWTVFPLWFLSMKSHFHSNWSMCCPLSLSCDSCLWTSAHKGPLTWAIPTNVNLCLCPSSPVSFLLHKHSVLWPAHPSALSSSELLGLEQLLSAQFIWHLIMYCLMTFHILLSWTRAERICCNFTVSSHTAVFSVKMQVPWGQEPCLSHLFAPYDTKCLVGNEINA